jgi:MSHA biogenesis protein MshP
MYLNAKPLMYMQSNTRQKGSSLVIALFIIVVFMLLGTAMVRILSTGAETIAYEVLGTRSLAAANSALQADLQLMFPQSETTACPVHPITDPITPDYDFSSVVGLENCSAEVICTNYANYDDVSYYRLESTGSCGDTSRTVQVEARSM